MLKLSKMNDRNWLTIDLILSNNHDHYISWFVLGYRLSWPWPLNGWVVSGHKTNVYLDARMFIQACHWWILHMVANDRDEQDFSLIIFHIVIKTPTKSLNFRAASGCEISRAVHRWVSMAHIVVASEIFDGREGIVLHNCGTGHKSSFFQPPFVMRITAPQAWILFAGLKNMSLIFHGEQLTQFWCSDSSRF